MLLKFLTFPFIRTTGDGMASQCGQISVYLISKILFLMFEMHFQIFEIQSEIIISENEF